MDNKWIRVPKRLHEGKIAPLFFLKYPLSLLHVLLGYSISLDHLFLVLLKCSLLWAPLVYASSPRPNDVSISDSQLRRCRRLGELDAEGPVGLSPAQHRKANQGTWSGSYFSVPLPSPSGHCFPTGDMPFEAFL